MTLRVTIWNENIHEQQTDSVPAKIYPNGMHGAIKTLLENELQRCRSGNRDAR